MYFQNICRVCIREDVEMTSIFESYKFYESCLEICEVITNCASVQIHKLDGFSAHICKNCLDDLYRAYRFKQTCEESDYKFRNNLIHNDKIIISERLPIVQCESDEINEKNKEVRLSFHNELPAINSGFYKEETKLQDCILKNQLHDSTDSTTLEILNGALPGSLESTAPAISDTFPEEDIQIKCSEAKIKINQKIEEIYTSLEYGLTEIKSESYDTHINCGENLLQEPNVKIESTTLQKLNRSLQITGKPHKCEICNKRYTQKYRLNAHKRIHTGEKPNKCEKCGKCFSQLGHLIIHKMKHTGDTPHKCETCGKRFNQEAYLKLHIRRSHAAEISYKCEICGSCFNLKALLNIHMNIHTGGNQYKCDTCGKSFQQKGHLTTHLRIHTGDKPYKCETCGKCFNQRGLLNIHIRIHTGDNPIKCKICGKCFGHMGSLNIHMRIHTGEKPYKCDLCGKCFSQNGSLTKHKRIHTGDKPYKCETCGKNFNDKRDIHRHYKNHAKCNVVTPTDNGLVLIKNEFSEEEAQIQYADLYEENSSTESLVKTEPTIIERISEEV